MSRAGSEVVTPPGFSVFLLMLLLVGLSVLSPFLGMGFGINALRYLRVSCGRKRGFVRAMFGTLFAMLLIRRVGNWARGGRSP